MDDEGRACDRLKILRRCTDWIGGLLVLAFLDGFGGRLVGVVDGLCDPKRRRRVALGLVCAYGAAWFIYGVIAKSSQDLNGDLGEMVVWSRQLALGYPKHPPLLAYVVKLWFSIFPLTDWAFLLLAAMTVSAGIYLAIELCGVWLDGEKRATVPFLLALIPFYNFLGLKFDQNSALIPLWALAMLALMHSLQSRRIGWAALAGIAAAAAMLTKYWSLFLLAAMAFAALSDRRRGAYFRSPAPWITALVFLAPTLPHLYWLVENHFPPLEWIGTRRAAQSAFDFIGSLSEYSFGTLGYSLLALAAVAVFVHPSGKAVRDSWFATEPARRPATLLFWTPLLLPIAVALVGHTNLLSLWNAPSLNLLPVMMLASPLVAVPRIAATRIAACAVAFTLIAVATSPLVALVLLKRGVENSAGYAQLAAAAAERDWRQTTKAPLRLVGGPFALANSMAFYMADRPLSFSDFWGDYVTPWADMSRIARDGMVMVCPDGDARCLGTITTLTTDPPTGRRDTVTLTRHWLGLSGPPKSFVIVTIPPRFQSP